ncbi:MAG: hypothetical protein Q9221_008870 [Calogaya cf. arnoldii]
MLHAFFWVLLSCLAHASGFPPNGLDSETIVPVKASPQINPFPPSPPPPSLQDLPHQVNAQGRPIPPYPIVRHVTGTRTIVQASLQPQPLNTEAVGWTLKQTQYGIEGVIYSVGDSWLPASREPYSEDFQYGCYISMWSNKVPGPGGRKQRLTWGIMNSTLEGLFNIAYVQGYSYEMRFDVLDSGWGIVALGYIKSGSMFEPGLRKGGGREGDTEGVAES